jgi:hypothetical protein
VLLVSLSSSSRALLGLEVVVRLSQCTLSLVCMVSLSVSLIFLV